MTEAEWLICNDPIPLLELLLSPVSARKLRLLACACAFYCRPQYPDETLLESHEIAEQFADGDVSDEEREAAFKRVAALLRNLYRTSRQTQTHEEIILNEQHRFGMRVGFAVGSRSGEIETNLNSARQHPPENRPHNLRCIFGNPLRPVTFSTSWRTSTAVALASQMYESRDFGTMPILADALQDAGCGNEDILSHCRGSGPHVRGCWVVDAVLNKE